MIKPGKRGCKFKSHEKTFTVESLLCDFVVDKTGAGDCETGVFCALKSIGKSNEETPQTAVNYATESIKNYGMFHLVKD